MSDATTPASADDSASLLAIKTAAEKYQRVFFVEYDMSVNYGGIVNGNNDWVANIENDWLNYIASPVVVSG